MAEKPWIPITVALIGVISTSLPVILNNKINELSPGDLDSGQKICSVVVSGNWRDTLVVPTNWAEDNCKNFWEITDPGKGGHYNLGCVFNNQVSLADKGQKPEPNCGW